MGSSENKEKAVLFILASKNFQDIEYFESKKLFDKKGIKTKTASSYIGESVGMFGGVVIIDILFSEIDALFFDAIIYVGGQGTLVFWDDWRAKDIAKIFLNHNKIVAAIGSGCVIIANSGILKDVNATCEKSDERQLLRSGSLLLNEDIVVSDKIITARSGVDIQEFICKIIDNLE